MARRRSLPGVIGVVACCLGPVACGAGDSTSVGFGPGSSSGGGSGSSSSAANGSSTGGSGGASSSGGNASSSGASSSGASGSGASSSGASGSGASSSGASGSGASGSGAGSSGSSGGADGGSGSSGGSRDGGSSGSGSSGGSRDGGSSGSGSGGRDGGSGSSGASSSGSSGSSSSGNSSSGSSSSGGSNCTTPPAPSPLVGWATASGSTSGGAAGSTVTVTTLSALQSAVNGTNAQVVQVRGTIDTGTGGLNVGSNKTIVGLCGAEIRGHIQMSGSSNVIVRNLKIVGYNCAAPDTTSCSSGLDAITVEGGNQHLWFDHDDISDGTDGNLDITHGADYITISWTKFHYSGRRSTGHQFCNLIGHSDSNGSEDTGHLRVTFHHDWWADNVDQRMPRVRFGQVHIFNSLYTAAGDSVCIEMGVSGNVRDENNVFINVNNPIDLTHTNSASVIQSSGNLYMGATGTQADTGGSAFTPPYTYTLDSAASVQSAVTGGAGPH